METFLFPISFPKALLLQKPKLWALAVLTDVPL